MIQCTLLGDGSSDAILRHPINWLLKELYPNHLFKIDFADLRNEATASVTLIERIKLALELFPCELLFIHRDTEGGAIQQREREILYALGEVGETAPLHVFVIPERMTEAWFLHDEEAIRRAANNPNGRIGLRCPGVSTVHSINDPKRLLENLLITASGRNARRLKKFRPRKQMHRLAELIEDFSPLRNQDSFINLERQLMTLRNSQILS